MTDAAPIRRSASSRFSRPRVALVAFCVALLVFGLTRRGRSTESVDVRTYVEMTRSVAEHGIPYFDNGPVGQFISLRSPFNLYTHGHLWGIYGPAYAYFAALPFRFGGLIATSIATCLLLIPLALVTFAMTRRLLRRDEDDRDAATKNDWYALAAAILVVISTPALGKSLEMSGYPLAMLLAAASAALTLEAISTRGRRRLGLSVGVGVLCAAGSATHLLCLPMSLALFGALAVCDASSDAPRGPAWLESTALRALWPTRATILSAAAATLAMIVCTSPIAVLNHVRFGSANPFSYGPVPWFGMEYLGASNQTISDCLREGAPVLGLVGFLVIGWLVGASVRRRWEVRGVVLAIAVALYFLSPALRDKCAIYARAAYAFTIDQSLVELGVPYRHLPGTFASLNGPWATKSPLQCTPILLLGLLLPRVTSRAKQLAFAVLAPCAALFVYLMLRGNLPLFSALGVPWVYLRYTLPGLPMLVASAMVVARDVGLGPADWLVAAVIGAALTIILWSSFGDEELYRQILVLALPVAIAVLSTVAVVLHRHGRLPRWTAAASIALACGVGIGIGVGHDFRAHHAGKTYCDMRADAMRRAGPARFAMFGLHPTLDPVLAVTVERDVQYADMAEGDRSVDPWQHVRPLLDYWFADDRPVFFVADNKDHKIPWPDMQADLVDADNLIYRITRR